MTHDLQLEILFVLQMSGFALAWIAVVWTLVRPAVDRLAPATRLAVWVAPQCFRFLGIGLLVPALAPGLTRDFAEATAAGDSLTSLLAIATLWTLHHGARAGRTLAWATTVVGLTDGLVAMAHAAHVGAADHLAAQWYVPVLILPLMGMCHAMTVRELRRSRPSRR